MEEELLAMHQQQVNWKHVGKHAKNQDLKLSEAGEGKLLNANGVEHPKGG